jgi:hypothetical protein
MKIYRGVEVIIPPILTLALDVGEWLALWPGHFTPGEISSGSHWIGGWWAPESV